MAAAENEGDARKRVGSRYWRGSRPDAASAHLRLPRIITSSRVTGRTMDSLADDLSSTNDDHPRLPRLLATVGDVLSTQPERFDRCRCSVDCGHLDESWEEAGADSFGFT